MMAMMDLCDGSRLTQVPWLHGAVLREVAGWPSAVELRWGPVALLAHLSV